MMDIPKNKSIMLQLGKTETFPYQTRNEPVNKLKSPHNTLMNGDDRPFPGGFAKGVGNLSPETP